jgi:glycosyltransferase involved in cell wall biosynthesis
MPELSVLIPARNEMFLQRTIEDVLKNSGDKTEIIVVLDGYWPDEGLPVDPRVTIIHHEESIGQRGATNEAARVSRAKYIMKLDAHCAIGKGFDEKLIEAAKELGPDVTQVPAQYNLHAYDWQCEECGERTYQGPTPGSCSKCGHGAHHREMVWKRRKSRLTTSWRFDRNLKFQYWGQFKNRPEGQKKISETLSLLGACWFMERKRYWELDGLDEEHGSWGQMGTEIACKSWLSGGRLVCNKRTWFAHMFRTQGGDFSFPYPISGNQVNRARKYSQELWIDGKWPKQKHTLEWLLKRFAPVPEWEEAAPVTAVAPTKGIVYYSDCRGDETILRAAQEQLVRAVNGHEIVAVTLAPLDYGDIRIVLAKLERGYLTMFRQILAGLELSNADVIFFAEHDVLYHPSHFDFTPPDQNKIYYNENVWKVSADDGRALFYHTKQTSGLCAYREVLLEHYRKRVALVEEHGFSRKMGFEPGSHSRSERVDDLKSEAWVSEFPNVDIRHGDNLTPSRWRQDQFRNQRSCRGWKEASEVPGWGKTKGRFGDFLVENKEE